MSKPTGALRLLALGVAVGTVVGGCARGAGSEAEHDHGHGHDRGAAEQEIVKGAHNGRLLVDGAFALEVAIFERGVPPEFRIYAYEADEPLDPREVDLTLNLHRFGGRLDRFEFEPREGYLVGNRVVEEPHSFEVEIAAHHDGETHAWRYESWEGRTEIAPAAIAGSGIEIETAGPATIRSFVTAHGRIVANDDRLAHFVARYPGVVKEARKRLGDDVVAGEVLAIIESNDSLQPYSVKSAMAGTVIAKDVTPGEFTSEDHVIYTVADLSSVWADLNVAREDIERLEVGQTAVIRKGEDIATAQGKIVYVSPFGAQSTQTLLARVEIANESREWRPGLFVTGEILVDEARVPVSVKATGLQTFRDWDVVFLNDETVFQAMPLEIGRRDAEWVEVLSGVEAGQRYAADGSFVVKADVQKSGATHDH